MDEMAMLVITDMMDDEDDDDCNETRNVKFDWQQI
jgi:hypothetical protein